MGISMREKRRRTQMFVDALVKTEADWLCDRLNECTYAIASSLSEWDEDAKQSAEGSHEKYEHEIRLRIANTLRPYFELISHRA
jgi:hypothetical protein